MEKRVLSADEKRRKIIIISAVAALIALILGIALALVLPNLISRRVDYLKDDLGKYIEIDRESYLGYTLNVSTSKPTDLEVSELVMRAQVKHRELLGLGQYKTEGEMGVGDLILFRYYAYTDDGPIKGASTLTEGLIEYTVGAGFYIMNSAVCGLDEDIVGKRIEDISMSLGTAGTVSDSVIVYLSYELTDGESVTSHINERIDLSDPDVDSVMGDGFREFIVGKPVGSAIKDTLTTTLGGKSVTYYAVKVDSVGKGPLVASGVLPFDYYNDTLASKTVFFDLYIEKYIDYTVPEADEAFVSEKLGYSSFLDDYEGDTLFDRYKSYLMSELMAEYESRRRALIEDLIWERLLSSAKVKRLPKNDVNDIYDSYYEEILYQHETIGQGYSIGEFARVYIGLDASEDWQAYLVRQAEAAVTEKLLFFYIIRSEGWCPAGDTLDEYYDKAADVYVNAALEASGISPEDYEDKAEYNKIVAEVKAGIISDFGSDYFYEIAYSEYGWERLLENITIVDNE